MEFLNNADILLKTFWYIAITVSLIFIVQSVLTFAGASADTDTDSDFHDVGSPFEFFTVRNVINFLLGFSWGGISFYNTIPNKIFLILAAISMGIIFVALFFYLIQQIKKLEENNSFSIQKALNKKATVYLRIPEKGAGKGLVQVSVQGSIHELEAVSEDELLETGSDVVILDLNEDNSVIVKRII
ncbi:MAG: serine protease [Saprospiraceae bacterium]|nr:serine protease [Saprospiraceae bacterium]